jgi:predicted small lipoprotein YifL
MTRTTALLLAAALALTACGKRGPPAPVGPADQITYPKLYPSQ